MNQYSSVEPLSLLPSIRLQLWQATNNCHPDLECLFYQRNTWDVMRSLINLGMKWFLLDDSYKARNARSRRPRLSESTAAKRKRNATTGKGGNEAINGDKWSEYIVSFFCFFALPATTDCCHPDSHRNVGIIASFVSQLLNSEIWQKHLLLLNLNAPFSANLLSWAKIWLHQAQGDSRN